MNSLLYFLRECLMPVKYWRNTYDYAEWRSQYEQKVKTFKNIHKGEDCFIIGNGPSLNKMDLEPLNNYYTFGLNKIFLLFERASIQVDYLASVNPLVVEQSQEEFKQLSNIPIFVSKSSCHGLDLRAKHITQLYTGLDWTFSEDLSKRVSEGFTVTYVAMQLAYYMGFQNVYLIGVDHSYKQTGNPNQEQVHEGDDENHFDPNYFKGMKWHLADVDANEISYMMARRQFMSEGRNIIDATVGGKLTIFPKMEYSEALSRAKPKS